MSTTAARGKILFILTSHEDLGNTGKKTGYYLPELAHPYNVLSPHYDIVFATPLGGKSPVDPGSVEAYKNDPGCRKFLENLAAVDAVQNTHKIAEFIGRENEFLAVVFPGGHGPMFDLPSTEASLKVTANIFENGGVVAAVCHGPAGIVNVRLSNGDYLINCKQVTCFSNVEEDLVHLTHAMPFLLEDKLKENGGIYTKAPGPWQAHVVSDGRVVTGQNPASSTGIAQEVIRLLTTD